MNTEADPISASRRGLGKWLFLLPVALLLAVVVTWWAVGLQGGLASGFSDMSVTFRFEDTSMLEAAAVIRPGAPIRFEGQGGFMITLMVKDMREKDAFAWIAELIDQEVVLQDGIIIVRDVSWLERSYRWTARWVWDAMGIRLWPNRS